MKILLLSFEPNGHSINHAPSILVREIEDLTKRNNHLFWDKDIRIESHHVNLQLTRYTIVAAKLKIDIYQPDLVLLVTEDAPTNEATLVQFANNHNNNKINTNIQSSFQNAKVPYRVCEMMGEANNNHNNDDAAFASHYSFLAKTSFRHILSWIRLPPYLKENKISSSSSSSAASMPNMSIEMAATALLAGLYGMTQQTATAYILHTDWYVTFMLKLRFTYKWRTLKQMQREDQQKKKQQDDLKKEKRNVRLLSSPSKMKQLALGVAEGIKHEKKKKIKKTTATKQPTKSRDNHQIITTVEEHRTISSDDSSSPKEHEQENTLQTIPVLEPEPEGKTEPEPEADQTTDTYIETIHYDEDICRDLLGSLDSTIPVEPEPEPEPEPNPEPETDQTDKDIKTIHYDEDSSTTASTIDEDDDASNPTTTTTPATISVEQPVLQDNNLATVPIIDHQDGMIVLDSKCGEYDDKDPFEDDDDDESSVISLQLEDVMKQETIQEDDTVDSTQQQQQPQQPRVHNKDIVLLKPTTFGNYNYDTNEHGKGISFAENCILNECDDSSSSSSLFSSDEPNHYSLSSLKKTVIDHQHYEDTETSFVDENVIRKEVDLLPKDKTCHSQGKGISFAKNCILNECFDSSSSLLSSSSSSDEQYHHYSLSSLKKTVVDHQHYDTTETSFVDENVILKEVDLLPKDKTYHSRSYDYLSVLKKRKQKMVHKMETKMMNLLLKQREVKEEQTINNGNQLSYAENIVLKEVDSSSSTEEEGRKVEQQNNVVPKRGKSINETRSLPRRGKTINETRSSPKRGNTVNETRSSPKRGNTVNEKRNRFSSSDSHIHYHEMDIGSVSCLAAPPPRRQRSEDKRNSTSTINTTVTPTLSRKNAKFFTEKGKKQKKRGVRRNNSGSRSRMLDSKSVKRSIAKLEGLDEALLIEQYNEILDSTTNTQTPPPVCRSLKSLTGRKREVRRTISKLEGRNYISDDDDDDSYNDDSDDDLFKNDDLFKKRGTKSFLKQSISSKRFLELIKESRKKEQDLLSMDTNTNKLLSGKSLFAAAAKHVIRKPGVMNPAA